jgi:hypothetical protein
MIELEAAIEKAAAKLKKQRDTLGKASVALSGAERRECVARYEWMQAVRRREHALERITKQISPEILLANEDVAQYRVLQTAQDFPKSGPCCFVYFLHRSAAGREDSFELDFYQSHRNDLPQLWQELVAGR